MWEKWGRAAGGVNKLLSYQPAWSGAGRVTRSPFARRERVTRSRKHRGPAHSKHSDRFFSPTRWCWIFADVFSCIFHLGSNVKETEKKYILLQGITCWRVEWEVIVLLQRSVGVFEHLILFKGITSDTQGTSTSYQDITLGRGGGGEHLHRFVKRRCGGRSLCSSGENGSGGASGMLSRAVAR